MPGQPLLLKPKKFADPRGWFMETFSARTASAAGIETRFVQDNHSFSASSGTIRGLHFQAPPHAQAKLVRCVRGSIMDYAVDIRRGSPTFGSWVAAKLTAEGGEQLFVPVGFAHGFITLEAGVEVIYKVSDLYAPACDGGIVWNDATIGIDWPLPEGGPTLSDKDRALPTLEEFESPFQYGGQPLEPLSSFSGA